MKILQKAGAYLVPHCLWNQYAYRAMLPRGQPNDRPEV